MNSLFLIMVRFFSMAFFSLCSFGTVYSQEYFTLKAGSRVRDVLEITDIYQSSAFVDGVVQFKRGTTGRSKMNYNRFSDEIEFIQGKDTLNLLGTERIKYITMGDFVFYPTQELRYVQRIAETRYTRLVKKDNIILVDKQKESGYGTMSSTSAISSYGGYVMSSGGTVYGGRMLSLVAKENLIYRRDINYYFGDDKGNFVHADKKSILKLYPEKKTFLSTYLKENEIDFEDEVALKELLTIISEAR